MRRNPIALTGFSGAGKTSVGQALVLDYGLNLLDVDAEVERQSGTTITELIRVEGEQRFRALEKAAIAEAVDASVDVIVLGGGALRDPKTVELLRSRTLLIHLAIGSQVAAERILRDELASASENGSVKRPIVTGVTLGNSTPLTVETIQRNAEQLMSERAEQYSNAQLCIWTEFATPAEIAETIYQQVRQPNFEGRIKTIVPTGLEAVDPGRLTVARSRIVIGSDIVPILAERIKQDGRRNPRVALLIDENVNRIFGEQIVDGITQSGLECTLIEITSGEVSKDFINVSEISESLISAGFTRSDVLLVIGGGVTGDLGGLVGSLFMRGMRLIQVPTTVVGQVDSAIGGKTAVNLKGGKNLLGTFYPGFEIISSVDFLQTLPDREYLSGIAEVVKYGLVYSELFFIWLEDRVTQIIQREPKVLLEIVERCSIFKQRVVERDLMDISGERAKLNFGHTVGHCLEKLAGYGILLHGEAVAIGMVEALKLGASRGSHEFDLVRRVAQLLKGFSLPTAIPENLLVGSQEYLKAVKIEDTEVNLDRSVELHDADSADFETNRSFAAETAGNTSSDCWAEDDSSAARFRNVWMTALRADKKRTEDFVNFILLNGLGRAEVVQIELDSLLRSIARS